MTKNELKTAIGKRIIEIRSQKGLSQSGLARVCNKDRQAIEKLENGKVNPTIYSLYEITTALKISMKELFDF